ncbi:hypothetical protein C0995_000174 [Termitomyces sp. Mi166|nr:hypothetical protein C0995_000174 [Termitomyces sp. Mi166\
MVWVEVAVKVNMHQYNTPRADQKIRSVFCLDRTTAACRATRDGGVDMEVDTEDAAPHPLTIVRIKRKRNEEPLDALESRVRRKKSRGMGVFKFAQTVEKDAWEDEEQAKQIQDQISRLTREAAALPDSQPSAEPQYVPPPKTKHKDEARHYTVLSDDYDDQNSESPRVSRPVAPPKILAAKDLPPKNSQLDFKMFDAVLTTDNNKPSPTPMDSDMEKFLPMLNDYLKLHDVVLDQLPTEGKGASPSKDVTMQTNDDYVWDVFYHRPATLSEWNQAVNVATLSGLPLAITNSYESASESEEEDEADEDSNAEEYYKNDYPEDEDDTSSESDEFHEHSDYDDMMGYD